MADTDSAQQHLITHLRDAHALEVQARRQLERACEICADDERGELYKEHLEQTLEHERQIHELLKAHDVKPSAVKDLTMRSGAIGLRQLADVAPDTPVKLAMHFFAFENLEIATYEMLCLIAEQTGDGESADVARKILEQEREAAEKVKGTFEQSVKQLLESEVEGEEADSSEAESSDSEREGEPAASGAER